MPGPKMGPRPPDFNEDVIRQSPTFTKWLSLEDGEKLRYACRDFTKGHGQDEERLMRRIMIARRNNIRDHETLKRARQEDKRIQQQHQGETEHGAGTSSRAGSGKRGRKVGTTIDTIQKSIAAAAAAAAVAEAAGAVQLVQDAVAPIKIAAPEEDAAANSTSLLTSTIPEAAAVVKASPPPTTTAAIKTSHALGDDSGTNTGNNDITNINNSNLLLTDAQVLAEMDVPAVERTRSYKSWWALPDNSEFLYNQTYIKGKPGHDWLLRKNIWRRMRYRRENKKLLERLNLVKKGPVGTGAAVAVPPPRPGAVNQKGKTPITTTGTSSTTTVASVKQEQEVEGTRIDEVVAAVAATAAAVLDADAVEAAVAAAESFSQQCGRASQHELGEDGAVGTGSSHSSSSGNDHYAALDAAAKLAAAQAQQHEDQNVEQENEQVDAVLDEGGASSSLPVMMMMDVEEV